MKIVGVVAEFNPFHNGHKYQVEYIKKNLKPDILIAVVSNDFVQRGELSILHTRDKVNIAINQGYDIVVEIPSIVSFQNAQIYCSVASRILNKLGCTMQVFGAETENLEIMKEMIEKLNNENIKKYLSNGLSYNNACSKVLNDFGLDKYYTSNNILAMEYIRAIKEYDLKQVPYVIKRINVGYNEEKQILNISSATHIRKLIKENKKYYNLVPYDTNDIKYIFNYKDELFKLFKYIFLTKKIDDIYDLSLDIKNYISNRIKKVNTYDEFLKICESRNISKNRIKRIILNVVLDIRKIDIEQIKREEISDIKILGINEKGAKYIKNLDFCKVNFKDLDEDYRYEYLLNYLGINKKEKNTIYINLQK